MISDLRERSIDGTGTRARVYKINRYIYFYACLAQFVCSYISVRQRGEKKREAREREKERDSDIFRCLFSRLAYSVTT